MKPPPFPPHLRHVSLDGREQHAVEAGHLGEAAELVDGLLGVVRQLIALDVGLGEEQFARHPLVPRLAQRLHLAEGVVVACARERGGGGKRRGRFLAAECH